MAILTCKLCRKLFNGTDKKICVDCLNRLDDLYPKVRDYIRDHPKEEFNVETVADALDQDIRYVQELVNLGYLDRDVPDGGLRAPRSEREKLAKAFEASIDKLRASTAAQQQSRAVSYGQELYGDKSGRKR